MNTHERGAGMTGDHIGRSLRRLEDERFLTGQGCYVDDIAVPGQLYGVVLRSPHGHAVIEGIDAVAARATPGVHGVFTAADLDADGIGKLPCIAQVATASMPSITACPWGERSTTPYSWPGTAMSST